MIVICKQYEFSSAHELPLVPEGHRCKNLHGHHYILEVEVTGSLVHGWIMDFYDLDNVVMQFVKIVDHKYLNGISGLENPTAEKIADWFFIRIENLLQCTLKDVKLTRIRVYETPTCWAEITK